MNLAAPAPLLGLIAAFRAVATEVRTRLPAIKRTAATRKPGHVTLLGAGPGAADLITLRGLAALQSADVIYFDRLADIALLAHAKPGAICISVGKSPGHHSVPQDQINARLVASARLGHRVVRLKCGDPGIFGRELQDGLITSGWPEACPVEVISKAQTPDQRVLRGSLADLTRLCQSHHDLNPAILLIRWPATPALRSSTLSDVGRVVAQGL